MGGRRAGLAAALHEATDPDAPDAVREMLGHAASVLDVGRAIDYYDRFESTFGLDIRPAS